jgi:glycosyltransferase involved in cell wall biosynthesis
MKIIFLTLVGIDTLDERGIYHDLMNKFCEEGHEVLIVTPSERRLKQPTVLINKGKLQILKVWIPNIQKTNIIEKGIGTLLIEHFYKRAIKRYFKLTQFDLIIYSTPPITFTSLIKKLKGNSVTSYLLLKDIFPQNAVDLGMFKKNGFLHSYFRRKEKELYAISDWIGCMSPANVKYVLENNSEVSAEKVEVNPNSLAISSNHFEAKENGINKKYGIPANKTVFIYGGNMGRPQGLDFLLKAIPNCQTIENAFFLIVGGGTEFAGIKRWFDTNKPINAVLLSELSKKEYDELIGIAHVGLIFLSPLFSIPNYPSRLLSYMENRMPVICATDKNTDVGTMAEDNGYGFKCLNGDLDSFKHYVELLATDSDLVKRVGDIGYNYFTTHFNVNNSYALIIDKKQTK